MKSGYYSRNSGCRWSKKSICTDSVFDTCDEIDYGV